MTRAVLALQKTNGYVEFSLPPPHVSADGLPHFEIIAVTFDPAQISPDALARIIAAASGLAVTEVK